MQPDQKLLHYQLTEKLGEGGMGVVWKATDSTLGREVAIKILPADFADDDERLARFDREARLLASLNHPNIASIYGIHEDGGTHFLAMELVPGEDLSQRLLRGPLPMDQAVRIAREIAGGLEAAHESGVIHRDLKPANVRLTADGTAKILDFGLAKAAEAATKSSATDPARSPTITAAGTQAGMIMGTASYMSPEQAAGQPVDRRCDIWSFGVLLHELVTGRRMFDGETISHTLAAVLRAEIDLEELPKGTPRQIKQLIRRCLEREPARRLRDIGEARILLEDLQSGQIDEPGPMDRTEPESSRLPWLVAIVAAAGLIALAGWWIGRSGSRAQVTEPLHVELAPPEGTHYDLHHGRMVVSPDGRSVAFIAQDAEGRRHLWVRDLREPSARRLEGTEGARMPFWSPDGEHLGFGARSGLKRVPARGGAVDTVTAGSLDMLEMRSALWTGAGEILVGVGGSTHGLYKVPASGGTPEPVPGFDTQSGRRYQSSPHPVAGTDALLVTQRSGQGNSVMILDGDKPARELMQGDFNVAYVDPGQILYWRDGGLRARPFDKKTLQLTGEPRLIAAGVAVDPSHLVAHFSVSGGTLAYIKGAEADSQSRLVLRNRAGEEIGTVGPPGNYYYPRFSPDGRRVAVDNSGIANNGDIWIHDLERPVGTRVSRDPANESSPVWSPDGKQIVFWSSAQGNGDLFIHRVGDSAAPVYMMGEAELNEFPEDWSEDGSTIALARGPEWGGSEIWLYDLDSGEIRPLQPGAAKQNLPTFSPDGKFLAYTSRETGRNEVFLRELATDGRAWQVSLEGGDGARWRADGRELFFLGADGFLHAVDVALGEDVALGRPTPLFRARVRLEGGYNYDVAPDGQSFVISSWIEEEAPRVMSVVLNWAP